ncbi:translation initiation factor fusion with methylthioribose kinase, putative [Ichthyophthirius multifiliis]|uniref:S-methyl-5-thioribose kinase n=1 Tax=Ichthyophthirius multifiliis TaxID=5932 RepID=G0QYI6_ICHMU|nr:translation initiation factor fusion with methylthioribose kinase, putative [Ichthyophthirius multifiliis]EGR29711.1 translation initiation factor fusion with methylthioribose kinase, putative [Ichthyophthirius multifiliis]|eukprot:XP_004030947.1 translation initiation factor fusion with methylthioribose kinase, putative [Ichthyophthirius multifiliis]
MKNNFEAFRRDSPEYFYVLDQLKLPTKIEEIKIVTIEDTWNSIKDMNVRGAPLISVVATQGLRNSIQQSKIKNIHELKNLIKEQIIYIRTSRTTAVNLYNDTQQILEFLNERKLATPGQGTALGIVREMHKNGMLDTLYITETRPYNQGARLTATETVLDNIPSILITDNMVGALMFQQKVDLVITGADRVALNGDTANKIGTYQLAVLSKYHNVPFYVALPSQSICKKTLNHKQIQIEERPSRELTHIGDFQIAPDGIKVWNPSFDVTPGELITSIFHENGEYEFDRELGVWEMLQKENLFDYLVKDLGFFKDKEKLKILNLGDGNMNLVFAVCDEKQGKSVIVKQALPYVKCIGPSWPFSLSRSFYESKALQFEQKYCKEYTPEFYSYDKDKSVICMEYLAPPFVILRQGLLEFKKYDNMALHLADFVARTCFFSSGLHLSNKRFRELMSFWNGNNAMCNLTEQVIFSDPYVEAQYNRWTRPFLDEIVDQFKNKDEELILAITELRNKFISVKQALIHGDLHTGSVMVSDQQTKIIDPEFSFYGPIGFDLGAFIANLFINYFSLKQYGDSKFHVDFGEWILQQVRVFCESFENKFLELWNSDDNVKDGCDFMNLLIGKNKSLKEKAQQKYLKELFYDMVGFGAAKIIRRIIGVAHVQDFENIKDDKVRAQCENSTLLFARYIMVNRRQFNCIQEIIDLAKKYYAQ